ncbi:hypothetical protein [Nocardia mexicana]|uniref:Membrane protein YndG n=1 Tax=Nocardia mexicana TaxID=279262 RepID=A0A370GRU7_9NOCA|nr:hypothetical protein [Nocardia mexicana]RDI46422.1 hypothetical protein DFR68_111181 [Nocardia mexicana]
MNNLYIETRVHAEMDLLWERTQNPEEHRRWDLRFTEIDYLPREPGQPQHFRYATRLLPFRPIAGTGTSAGDRERPDGSRTSALRFASADRLSLIEEGSGYWRYIPTPNGIRFYTGYGYRVRWGRFGAVADRVFRPVMGWATAWSFDRLRLWCERGVSPRRSLLYAVFELLIRGAIVAAVVVALCVSDPSVLWSAALAGCAAAAVLTPPGPATPAARRCLRTPPARVTAPALLHELEGTS